MGKLREKAERSNHLSRPFKVLVTFPDSRKGERNTSLICHNCSCWHKKPLNRACSGCENGFALPWQLFCWFWIFHQICMGHTQQCYLIFLQVCLFTSWFERNPFFLTCTNVCLFHQTQIQNLSYIKDGEKSLRALENFHQTPGQEYF